MHTAGSRRTIADALAAIPDGQIKDILRDAADALYSPLQQQLVSVPFLEIGPDVTEFIAIREEMERAIKSRLLPPV